MSVLVDSIGGVLPDFAILIVTGLAFALFGFAVSWLSQRLWFRRWTHRGAFDDKLADTAHSSLLGLSAFVLALMITNGLTSLSRTDANVHQEAAAIYRLDRELDALGPQAADARATLAAYARDVASEEWLRLAAPRSSLSPGVQRDLDTLWTQLRTLQKQLPSSEPARSDLTAYAGRIELLRQNRFADSTSNIPGIFWLILVLFVAATSFLAGREAPKRFGRQVNIIHMAALGLAVGLVIVLANPFRGETSIDASIIGTALNP